MKDVSDQCFLWNTTLLAPSELLYVEVFSRHNPLCPDDILGRVVIPLAHFQSHRPVQAWLPIRALSGRRIGGDLQIWAHWVSLGADTLAAQIGELRAEQAKQQRVQAFLVQEANKIGR